MTDGVRWTQQRIINAGWGGGDDTEAGEEISSFSLEILIQAPTVGWGDAKLEILGNWGCWAQGADIWDCVAFTDRRELGSQVAHWAVR